MNDVVVIGGGLAGLINAIRIQRAGFSVHLFEEKEYPFHRVCGEYISNEVIPFLEENDLFPRELHPSKLSKFQLTAISGKMLEMPLDLGGFGISRFEYDAWLAQVAKEAGVMITHTRINSCEFDESFFQLADSLGNAHHARIVIGAFGKRSMLDKNINRPFLKKRSPYIGVKYHIKTDLVPDDLIALHNFEGGYCGVSSVGGDTFNLCYLSHRSNLKKFGAVEKMEEAILMQNPYLKPLLKDSEFVFDKPYVINEITFEKKEPVFDHVLMSGDAAGMITPLCGNGMAMATHSAKICSDLVIEFLSGKMDRATLERSYEANWNQLFAVRLFAGRTIQKLFGSSVVSEAAVLFARAFPPFSRFLMKKTHGVPF